MVSDISRHTSTDMTRRYATRSSLRIAEVLEFRGRLVDECSRKSTNNFNKLMVGASGFEPPAL